MELVYHICCGIDVHAKFLLACLLVDGKQYTEKYSTMTCGLKNLRDWLIDKGVQARRHRKHRRLLEASIQHLGT